MSNETRFELSLSQCHSPIFLVLVLSICIISLCSVCLNCVLLYCIHETKVVSSECKKLMSSGAVAATLACCQQFFKSAWYLAVFMTDSYEEFCLFTRAQCLIMDLPFFVSYGSFVYLTFSLIVNRMIIIWRIKHSKALDSSLWVTQSIIVSIVWPLLYMVLPCIWLLHSIPVDTRSRPKLVLAVTIIFITIIVGSIAYSERLMRWNKRKMDDFKKEGIQQNLDTRVALRETEKLASAFSWTTRFAFGGWMLISFFSQIFKPIVMKQSPIYYFGAVQHLFIVCCMTVHPILMLYLCVPLSGTLRRLFKLGPGANQVAPVKYTVGTDNVLISHVQVRDHVENLEYEWRRVWLQQRTATNHTH